MELATTAEFYQPSIDDAGNYIDVLPKFDNTRKQTGIRCPCANRDKVFYERANLYAHTKTKYHQDWLANLNREKTNHISELHNVKELVDQQKKIIAQQSQLIAQKDQEIKKLLDTITVITNLKLHQGPGSLLHLDQSLCSETNLLDFDV